MSRCDTRRASRRLERATAQELSGTSGSSLGWPALHLLLFDGLGLGASGESDAMDGGLLRQVGSLRSRGSVPFERDCARCVWCTLGSSKARQETGLAPTNLHQPSPSPPPPPPLPLPSPSPSPSTPSPSPLNHAAAADATSTAVTSITPTISLPASSKGTISKGHTGTLQLATHGVSLPSVAGRRRREVVRRPVPLLPRSHGLVQEAELLQRPGTQGERKLGSSRCAWDGWWEGVEEGRG